MWSRSALVLVVAVGLLGCGGASQDAPQDGAKPAPAPLKAGYKVVATTAMVGDLVRAVAGDRAGQVTVLIGEGADPHLFKPTRDHLQLLTQADLVFYNGLLLEGKMSDTLVKVARKGKRVYAVTELIDPARRLPDGDHEDPHVWMDVSLWARCVDVVRDALIEADPAGKDAYTANAAAYAKQLTELHAKVQAIVATIPPAQRVLVTAHDAFSYFGRAYGVEVRGIQGISTESEASLDDINTLVDMLVGKKIPAVFVESSVPEKNVRSLVEGAAKRGHELAIGGELFSDAMGAPGTYEGTYIGMIDHNATVVTRALGGAVDPRGLYGKLAVKE